VTEFPTAARQPHHQGRAASWPGPPVAATPVTGRGGARSCCWSASG